MDKQTHHIMQNLSGSNGRPLQHSSGQTTGSWNSVYITRLAIAEQQQHTVSDAAASVVQSLAPPNAALLPPMHGQQQQTITVSCAASKSAVYADLAAADDAFDVFEDIEALLAADLLLPDDLDTDLSTKDADANTSNSSNATTTEQQPEVLQPSQDTLLRCPAKSPVPAARSKSPEAGSSSSSRPCLMCGYLRLLLAGKGRQQLEVPLTSVTPSVTLSITPSPELLSQLPAGVCDKVTQQMLQLLIQNILPEHELLLQQMVAEAVLAEQAAAAAQQQTKANGTAARRLPKLQLPSLVGPQQMMTSALQPQVHAAAAAAAAAASEVVTVVDGHTFPQNNSGSNGSSKRNRNRQGPGATASRSRAKGARKSQVVPASVPPAAAGGGTGRKRKAAAAPGSSSSSRLRMCNQPTAGWPTQQLSIVAVAAAAEHNMLPPGACIIMQ